MDAKSDGPALDTVAKKMGIPTDMLIFFGGEAFCLLCAVLYHKFLSPGTVSSSMRHAVAMVLGICVGYFSFGLQFGHVVLQSGLCFVALQVLPSAIMHVSIFIIAMGYLISLHLYRAFAIPEEILYSIDVSGPLMIVTQKITILAFSIHDGCHGNKDKLSDLQKRYMIRIVAGTLIYGNPKANKVDPGETAPIGAVSSGSTLFVNTSNHVTMSKPPSSLEYFSYIFYFQGIVVGPLSFYKDYVAYIEGTDIAYKGDKNKQVNNNYESSNSKPSPFHSVIYKLSITFFWMLFHFTIKPLFPEVLNADPEFIKAHSFIYRVWYMLVSMLCCRAKYYVAFSLGDAICNASGFGFNGYDEKGKAKWDLITNVNILGIEFATSTKMYIDNWNIQTSLWLRHVCYDRIPTNKRFATFFLSALWHGCYPGYYFTFISGAIISEVWRKMRRKLRPYFLGSSSVKLFYDVMTWISTHLYISYIVIPFTVLHIRPTLTFFHNMYWFIHIISLVLLFLVLPFIPTPKMEKINWEPGDRKPQNKEPVDRKSANDVPVDRKYTHFEPVNRKYPQQEYSQTAQYRMKTVEANGVS